MKERRRKVRRRIQILVAILGVILLGAFIWLTWQPYVRVAEVSISNETPRLQALVDERLAGAYLGVIPRDSIFFVPKHSIRSAIFATFSEIQAVSIRRTGFTGLSVVVSERVPIARWCGLAPSPLEPPLPFDGEYCYLFDAEGFVYAAADVATSTAPVNSFALYDSLAGGVDEPLRATLEHAKQLPNLFDFARKVGSLGSRVASITIRGDETDLVLENGTRVTYVLGTEEATFASLTSAKNNLNLSDGSLLYIDLRFPGKVYLKKKDGTVIE